jgi:hypothetical protein
MSSLNSYFIDAIDLFLLTLNKAGYQCPTYNYLTFLSSLFSNLEYQTVKFNKTAWISNYIVQIYLIFYLRIIVSGHKLQLAVIPNTANVYLFENAFNLSYNRVSIPYNNMSFICIHRL